MTGLDCNILVQLALQDHPKNAATTRVVQAEVQNGSRLVFPALVVGEFLHVITDERRFHPPLTMPEALDWIDNFLRSASVGVIEPDAESLELALRWMRQLDLGRKRILDTQLAAAFYTTGVRRLVTSNPSDFTAFGVFEIITP